LASALLTGCGFVTSPEVPDVPDVECDPAFDDDAERVDFVDVDFACAGLVWVDFLVMVFFVVDVVFADEAAVVELRAALPPALVADFAPVTAAPADDAPLVVPASP
jgi:hypothetical protein